MYNTFLTISLIEKIAKKIELSQWSDLGLGGGVMGAPKSDLTLAKEELDFYYGIGKSKRFV